MIFYFACGKIVKFTNYAQKSHKIRIFKDKNNFGQEIDDWDHCAPPPNTPPHRHLTILNSWMFLRQSSWHIIVINKSYVLLVHPKGYSYICLKPWVDNYLTITLSIIINSAVVIQVLRRTRGLGLWPGMIDSEVFFSKSAIFNPR